MQKLSSQQWRQDFCWLALFLILFYIVMPDSHPLFVPDEGRYSEVAREMLASGDFITPRLNGVPFLDKPALFYWLQATAIYLFGLKEFALRLWPALCGIISCLATYLAGQRLFNRRTGLLAAIILASSPLYYAAAHYANLDLEVATWISLTLFMIALGLQTERSRQHTLFFVSAWFFAALAFLTKGLIALAFPIMITGSFLLLTGQWRKLAGLHFIVGPLLFASIVLPWCWLAQKANPEFFHFFFITQQITRFLSHADFNNREPFWFYLPVLLLSCLPWTVFLIQAIHFQIKLLRTQFKQNQQGLFFLLWVIIVFGFFSIPQSKTIGYILPITPALAILIGHYLAAHWHTPIFKLKPIKLVGALFICAIIFLIALTLSAQKLNKKTIKPLAMTLQQAIRPNTEVVTYYKYFQDLPLYLQKRITIVADWQAKDIIQHDNWVREIWYGMPFQDTHQWLINETTFWQRWYAAKPLVVLMDENAFPHFTEKAGASIKYSGKYNDIVWVTNTALLSS